MLRIVIIVLALTFMAACGESEADATLEEACTQFDACRDDATYEQCTDVFAGAVTPAECYAAMRDGPCEDHQQPTAYRESCFPTCFAPSQQCVNDTLLTCIDWGGGEFRRSILTCTGICEDDGLLYTGTCGRESPLGQTSEEDLCWCDEA